MVSRSAQQQTEPAEQPEQPVNRPYDEQASRFVERFAADLTEAGMQRMAARVFACLLASDSGSLSSAELGERLQISPAAISGAVRYLAQVQLVTRERQPGSRRDRYRVHSDVWHRAMTQRDAVLGRWINTFVAGIDALGPDTPAGRRMSESVAFFRFFEGELTQMMDRWYAHRRQLAEGERGTAGDPAEVPAARERD